MEDLLYRVALTFIPKVGAVTARNLMSYCGSARAVFEARQRELLKIPGVGAQVADNIRSKTALQAAEQEIRFMQQQGIQPVFYLDDDYPRRLKHLPDSPPLLYYRGQACLNPERCVAIVGTRKPTPLGVRHCEELVEGLKAYGVTVISGLAFGIDVAAHRAALQHELSTIGVVAHGLSRIYPPQHRSVAYRMVQENGGILSEYPSDTRPDRERFPMRNRIIAGLCDALVVVETRRRGGSMISAKMANDYHKDVFAVPGRLNDRQSEGCNLLIKSHQAALMESVEDLAYVMRWDKADQASGVQTRLFVDLSEAEERIVALLRDQELLSIDHLTQLTQRTNSELVRLLLELEFKGVVQSLPGKQYMLVR
ncbi:MAG: DNA-protecting protein DprA [Bacteroidetes bacterium]|jgi:DNA processing protein|nr:DNA-protecting protein DprA [Bacteroidota bacterium]